MKKQDPIVHCAHTKMVDIEFVKPNPRNPNHHPQKQIDLLATVIAKNGWRLPICCSNQSGYIVRGHCRLSAAKKMGLKSVPVDWQDYESESDEMADLLADARVAELAELSIPDVTDILADLDDGSFDLEATGYAIEEIERLMTWAPSEGGYEPAQNQAAPGQGGGDFEDSGPAGGSPGVNSEPSDTKTIHTRVYSDDADELQELISDFFSTHERP